MKRDNLLKIETSTQPLFILRQSLKKEFLLAYIWLPTNVTFTLKRWEILYVVWYMGDVNM